LFYQAFRVRGDGHVYATGAGRPHILPRPGRATLDRAGLRPDAADWLLSRYGDVRREDGFAGSDPATEKPARGSTVSALSHLDSTATPSCVLLDPAYTVGRKGATRLHSRRTRTWGPLHVPRGILRFLLARCEHRGNRRGRPCTRFEATVGTLRVSASIAVLRSSGPRTTLTRTSRTGFPALLHARQRAPPVVSRFPSRIPMPSEVAPVRRSRPWTPAARRPPHRTCPVVRSPSRPSTPPPMNTVDHAFAKWSRPLPLERPALRPHSPIISPAYGRRAASL